MDREKQKDPVQTDLWHLIVCEGVKGKTEDVILCRLDIITSIMVVLEKLWILCIKQSCSLYKMLFSESSATLLPNLMFRGGILVLLLFILLLSRTLPGLKKRKSYVGMQAEVY